MMMGLVLSLFVVLFWSLGEVYYAKLSKKYKRLIIYFYQYLARTIIYLFVVLIFNINMFTSFNLDRLLIFLPIILCDLFATYVVNIACSNGKLSIVSPIMAAYPIVDILFSVFLLKEQVSFWEILLSLVISIMIVILARNVKNDRHKKIIKGIIFAVIYMFLVAFSTYFEKTIYIADFSVYELYYYKGIIYSLTSLFFFIMTKVTKTKFISPNKLIIKGSTITPIGNVLYSFALKFGSVILVAPITSMYSVLTNFISRVYLKEKISLIERICIGIILGSTISLILIGVLSN